MFTYYVVINMFYYFFLLNGLLFYVLHLEIQAIWDWHLYTMWNRDQDTFVCLFFPLGHPADPGLLTFSNSLQYSHVITEVIIYVWVCLWTFASVPCVYLCTIAPITHWPTHYRFIMGFVIWTWIILLHNSLGYAWLFLFHDNFSISLPIFTKYKLLEFWLRLNWIYTSVWKNWQF